MRISHANFSVLKNENCRVFFENQDVGHSTMMRVVPHRAPFLPGQCGGVSVHISMHGFGRLVAIGHANRFRNINVCMIAHGVMMVSGV